jgi:drug/metabolite transporter (DMT)-like permease
MAKTSETTRAYLVLAVMPLFFSSNLVLGRAAVETVDPFTLAFFRWGLAAAILVIIAWVALRAHLDALRAQWRALLILGFLGMWLCGAIVYLALQVTTATNATLIYTASPIFVLLIEAARGRPIGKREMAGIAAALAGVGIIVFKADLGAFLTFRFNLGDLGILVCAFAWAVYSVVLKRKGLRDLPTLPVFTAIAVVGAVTLLPFMAIESLALARFPHTLSAWASILALAIVPSILAFGAYQYGVKAVGPAITAIFMYLLPVYGVAMAVFFLGEALAPFHLLGMALVVAGVVLATAPGDLLERLKARAAGA